MNDLDVRQAVQAAGEEISPAFRSSLAATLRAELAGEEATPVARVVSLDARRRRRTGLWGGIGIAGVAAATVTALVVTRDDDRGVVVTDTGPATTAPAPGSSVPGPTGTPTTGDGTATTSADTVAPTTTVPGGSPMPATAPGATSQGSAVVSPDSAKQPLVAVALADLPVTPVPDERPELAPYVSFLPDGALLVLDVQAAVAWAIEPDGSIRWTTPVPATLDGATPWQAALGPDDVLYVSYVTGDAFAPEGFSVAAVPTSGDAAGTAVRRWATDWECVEGTCGEVTLLADGIRVRWEDGPDAVAGYVDAAGAPGGATYDASTLEQVPSISEVPLPDGYAASSTDGAFYGAGGLDVTLGPDAWHLDALGVQFVEGAFTYASEQADGSALAWVTTTKDPALPGVSTLVRLLPGGAIEQYLPPQHAFVDVTSVGGVLYGVDTTSTTGGGGYRLVALIPEGDTTTGSVDVTVPTTLPATPSGLPPAVVDLPDDDGVLVGTDRPVTGAGPVLAVRADGSGDVFTASPAAGGTATLQLLRADGSLVDLGIEVSGFGGAVASFDDRLYVWSRGIDGSGEHVVWQVYEPLGADRWEASGDPVRQAAAGECSFYAIDRGCLGESEAAPLVDGDRIDWVRADDTLTSLTASLDGALTTRALEVRDLDSVDCFDLDCSFQFAPGPGGSVVAWQVATTTDSVTGLSTSRVAVTLAGADGASRSAWLPDGPWYVAGVLDDQLVAWQGAADGATLGRLATFDLASLVG